MVNSWETVYLLDESMLTMSSFYLRKLLVVLCLLFFSADFSRIDDEKLRMKKKEDRRKIIPFKEKKRVWQSSSRICLGSNFIYYLYVLLWKCYFILKSTINFENIRRIIYSNYRQETHWREENLIQLLTPFFYILSSVRGRKTMSAFCFFAYFKISLKVAFGVKPTCNF